MSSRRIRTIAATTLAASALALPAAAHVSVSPSEAPADGYARFAFRTPHGCDGAATNVVSVQIPTGVISVKPEMVVGWDVTTETVTYDESVELHGTELTEGVGVVTWTAQAGYELPDDLFREFGITAKMPVDAGTLYFPTVQECVDGNEIAWIEIPAEGEDGHALESPAPAVTLVAADAGHGDHDDHDDDMEHDEADDTATESMEAAGNDQIEVANAAATVDDGTDAIVWVALAFGVVGTLLGLAGLSSARRARS